MAPTSSQPAGQRPQRAEVLVQLDQFWNRVTEGLAMNQLWAQFHADARASFRLYQRDFDKRTQPEVQKHRWFRTMLDLAWAILEKLTPARRLLLLLGVVLLILPGGGFSYEGAKGGVQIVQFDLRFFGGALLFIVLMLEVADRVVMKRDLEIARDIQHWLLPSTPPQVPALEIAFATRPANTVAGDFYDVFPRPSPSGESERFLLAVADVAGKSIPAALLMATFQASLRTLSATSCSLPELVAGMNRYACTNSQGGLRFTTAFVAEFEPASRTLTYINAGHNAPVLRRTSETIERLASGGLPLGIQPDVAYESAMVKLRPDDWLVIFTDGLVEAENAHGEEYGETKLLDVLRAGAEMAPQDLLRRMMVNLDAYVGSTPQHDDVTCMVLRVN